MIMTLFAICIAPVLVVAAAIVIGRLRHRPDNAPLNPAAMTRAAVELHRINRKLDVAYTRVERRRDFSRLRREIGRALDDEDG